MSKMIQVRDVPDRLHRELMRRARRSGSTLTGYVQAILEREVAHPAPEELYARLRTRTRVDLGTSAASLIREERRERGDA